MRATERLRAALGRAWYGATGLRPSWVVSGGEGRAWTLTWRPHEVEDSCAEVHCYGHDRDEPGKAWLVCGECFHRYRSPGELRRRYRREAWRAHRQWRREPVIELPQPFTIPDEPVVGGQKLSLPDDLDLEWGKEPSTLQVLWRLLTVRARDVTFCQVCIHDL
jgi:hypothetical protein